MLKAAFFDIDGTLVHEKTGHVIPESAQKALDNLRAQGVKLIISTGRPTAMLPDFIKNYFDAFITLTGSYCYDSEGVYNDITISANECKNLYDLLVEKDLCAMFQYPDALYYNRRSADVIALEESSNVRFAHENLEMILERPAYQISPFLTPDYDEWLRKLMPNCIVTRWCDSFCDIIPGISSKPVGIKIMLDHYGISQEETIAFGDGDNDITMLEYCNIGVAMANGNPGCIAAADYVTTEVYNDGIANALRHFELID